MVDTIAAAEGFASEDCLRRLSPKISSEDFRRLPPKIASDDCLPQHRSRKRRALGYGAGDRHLGSARATDEHRNEKEFDYMASKPGRQNSSMRSYLRDSSRSLHNRCRRGRGPNSDSMHLVCDSFRVYEIAPGSVRLSSSHGEYLTTCYIRTVTADAFLRSIATPSPEAKKP